MKRDMDLIRRIVFKLEEASLDEAVKWEELTDAEHPLHEVVHHGILMKQAGLLDDSKWVNVGPRAQSLTWLGHEFADAARNESIWQKAKNKFQETGIALTMTALMAYLQQLAKEKLGLPFP